MSRSARVALATAAAGVLAATAAGLSQTRKGRQVTRKVRSKIQPMINQRIGAVIDAVETSLAEHGLLQVIPQNVRTKIHSKLMRMGGATSAGVRSGRNRAVGSQAQRRPSTSPRKRSRARRASGA